MVAVAISLVDLVQRNDTIPRDHLDPKLSRFSIIAT